jgi:hypothetical protein
MENKYVIVLGLVTATIVVGFNINQTEDSKSKDTSLDDIQQLAKELSSRGIIVEDILLTDGKGIGKAFNTTIEIPKDSRIAFVTFRVTPDKREGNKYLEEHSKVIYGILDADPTIDGVATWETTYASISSTALIVYAERSKADEIRDMDDIEELIDNFPLIEYTPK